MINTAKHGDNWDMAETFTAPNGMQGIRCATSDREGVAIEFSMHDATIQSMFPRTHWFPVFSAPMNNAKIDRIDGRLVVLCGLGRPNDPMGNLVLLRVGWRLGCSMERLVSVIGLVTALLELFEIRIDNSMEAKLRGN